MYAVFQQYLEERIALTASESDRIRSLAHVKRLRKKQYLLQEGDVWKYHAFVTAGCLRTYSLDEKGTEHIIHFAAETWWAGDRESLLTGRPARYHIDAVEDSEVLLFTAADFSMICREIPAFQQMVTDIIEKSLAASQNRIHAALTYTAEEKYLNFVSKYPGFANRIPQAMIASYLGITPETLSRVRTLTAKKHG